VPENGLQGRIASGAVAACMCGDGRFSVRVSKLPSDANIFSSLLSPQHKEVATRAARIQYGVLLRISGALASAAASGHPERAYERRQGNQDGLGDAALRTLPGDPQVS
jgi:hypothetical protein